MPKSTKVYVVEYGAYSARGVVAVCATLELAKKGWDDWEEGTDGRWYRGNGIADSSEIQEWEVCEDEKLA